VQVFSKYLKNKKISFCITEKIIEKGFKKIVTCELRIFYFYLYIYIFYRSITKLVDLFEFWGHDVFAVSVGRCLVALNFDSCIWADDNGIPESKILILVTFF